jgi:hypothetical protein
MTESLLAGIQRQQIEIAIGELMLSSDHYMQTSIVERIRHLIAHADKTLDVTNFSEMAREELVELGLLPPTLASDQEHDASEQ